ncbi:hypothetical protein Hypma_006345 [Hypsizygus marmoreus]|uniref:DUF6534 domain-containing protein n=1 Tax=Hypsizygus marmoreus TaxID=39966 RepID=A0A369JWL2_HYPMA|nr:hypothetical protein Hypma_006345 [Hypsizygus marmoreus]
MDCPPPDPPPIGSEVVLLPFTGALWGATCVQTFMYFVHYSRNDRLPLKLLVVWLWMADTVHLILTLLGVYQLTVVHYGDLAFVSTISPNFLTVVSCPVQLYFTYRIWIISGKNPLFGIVFVPLAIAQPAIYTGARSCYGNITTNKTLYGITEMLIAVWSTSAGIDVLIAASLSYYVWRFKTTLSGFRSTDKLLDRVAVLTINTGVWTALCSLFTIITITAFPSSPAFTAVAFLICPLYCNTLLANLNSRGFLRGSDDDPMGDQFRPSFNGSLAFATDELESTTRATRTTNDAFGISLGTMTSTQGPSTTDVADLKDQENKVYLRSAV